MKFKGSLIVILLLMALITIPISFASDIQSDFQIDIQSDIQNGIESSQLSDDLIINDNLEESVDDEILEENINLDGNILGLDDESSQYEVSSSSNLENLDSSSLNSNDQYNEGPDLNTSFAEIEIDCTDENTIFVNASYAGEEGNGTQVNPFKTLESAYDSFKNQSIKTNIYLAKGTYNLSETLNITKAVNLIGENPANTVISSLNKIRLLRISSSNSNSLFNIINLTFSKAYYYQGGAIYSSKARLNIINSIFNDNHGYDVNGINSGEGGAIYNDAGFIKIYNSTFSNNSIYGSYSKYGGAIYNKLGNLSIFNSKFINNSLQGDWTTGGAIYNFNGFLTIVNSSILNTTLTPKYHSLGGAICIWNGRNSYIINSTISNNTINGEYAFGSAIANKGVFLEIISSNITNNFANGISVENSTVYNMNGIYTFNNSIFSNNRIKTVKSNLLLCIEDQLILSDAFGIASIGELPSSYDLRDENLVTSVKNQKGGSYSENCWAFAIYASLESYLLKYENLTYDFSENNMKDAMYKNGEYGVDWSSGGNHLMAFAYLLRGSGPVNESQDPYDTSSIIPDEGLPISKYITGFKYIPLRLNNLDNDQIKYAILQYGALYTSIYSGIVSYVNGYSNIPNLNNHAVAIVGWDDNYSKDKFSKKPPGDGAWIVKNSWGTGSGQGGYYYVSYYDSTFPGVTDQYGAIAITSVDNLSEYKSIYQYDPLGNSYESIGYNSNTAWLANQFTADSNNPLKAFGIYTFGSSSYLLNVTVNGISKLVQEGNLIGAGYHTVKLNKLVDLLKGDKFRIAVKLTTPGSLFPIAIESYRTDYSTKVTASLGQSFISPDGVSWYDIAKDTSVVKFYQDLNKITLKKTNVCLKAYTEYADDLSLSIKSNSTYFDKGHLISFNVTISNNGDLSGEVNVSSVLDSSIDIVSFRASKGSFNNSTRIWTINKLNKGESQSLIIVLRFNEKKEEIKNSFYANSLSISSRKNVSGSIITYFVRNSTKIVASNMNVTSVVTSRDGKIGKYLKIKLIDTKSGKPLASKRIAFAVNNKTYYRTTDSNGFASLQINIAKAGTYIYKISFPGDYKYNDSCKTVKIRVKKQSLKLTVKNRKYRLKNKKKYLYATLKNAKGKRIENKKVTFTINGKKYSAKTNSNGIVKVKISLNKRKTYRFTVRFAGSPAYKAVSKKAKVTIK